MRIARIAGVAAMRKKNELPVISQGMASFHRLQQNSCEHAWALDAAGAVWKCRKCGKILPSGVL